MVVWGVLIATYLFLGGLAGGLFTSAAALEKYTRGRARREAEISALLSWVFMAVGLVLLVMDLGRPWNTPNILIRPHLISPMAWGAWVISLFTVVAFLYWLAVGILRKPLGPLKDALGLLGSILGVMTAAYTAILLGMARPDLWRSWSLPLLFVSSGFATGFALLAALVRRRAEEIGVRCKSLAKIELSVGLIELFAVLIFFVTVPSTSLGVLLSADLWGILFLVGFLLLGLIVGEIIIPAAVVAVGESATMTYLCTLLVLAGGYLLRYVLVYAAQV